MREQEVRELYEAYMQVHQVQEEVEQLDEEAPERITKPTKNKRLMKDAGPARVHNPKNVDEEVEQLDEISPEVILGTKHKRMQNLAAAEEDENRARDTGATMGKRSKVAAKVSDAAAKVSKHRRLSSAHARSRARMRDAGQNVNASYEYDTFDTILEYLVAEGYADTNEAALAIMANMSEEWRESIVESIDLHEKLRKGTKGKISFTTGKDSNYNQAMTETNPRTGRQRGTSPELKAMGAHGRARRAQHDAEQSGDTEGAQRHAQRRGRLAHVVYNKTNRIIDRADND